MYVDIFIHVHVLMCGWTNDVWCAVYVCMCLYDVTTVTYIGLRSHHRGTRVGTGMHTCIVCRHAYCMFADVLQHMHQCHASRMHLRASTRKLEVLATTIT
jgi:hypothetical protein